MSNMLQLFWECDREDEMDSVHHFSPATEVAVASLWSILATGSICLLLRSAWIPLLTD